MDSQTRTVQYGDKLIILNGRDPLMYVDLTKKKLKRYKPPFITRVKNRLTKAHLKPMDKRKKL